MPREGHPRGRVACVAAALVVCAAAASSAEPPASRPPEPERGRTLYRQACQTCHGPRADGLGPAARFLEPRPRDLRGGEFRFRSTPDLPADADLARTIRVGIPGTSMPAFGGAFTERDVAALVAFLKSLSPAFADPSRAAEPVPISREGSPDAASVARGAALYARVGCAQCHGDGGAGDGPAAATLVESSGRPLPPTDFTRGVFKSGAQDADLYRAVANGMGGAPMPSFGGALTPPEIWDLVDYLRSLSDPNFLEKLLCRAP